MVRWNTWRLRAKTYFVFENGNRNFFGKAITGEKSWPVFWSERSSQKGVVYASVCRHVCPRTSHSTTHATSGAQNLRHCIRTEPPKTQSTWRYRSFEINYVVDDAVSRTKTIFCLDNARTLARTNEGHDVCGSSK